VSDAMNPDPAKIGPEATIKECASLMLKKGVGSLIVEKDGKLAGIITEKDVVKCVARGCDISKVKVKKVMTKKVHTIGPNDDLFKAMQRMKDKKVRRLPVVKKKKIVGMLTEKDLLNVQPELYDILKERYKVVMKKKPKSEYIEGYCDLCGNYGQLYRIGGMLVCEECKDEIT